MSDFLAENKQRMYINLYAPIGEETKEMVKENIFSIFGIKKENVRIFDEYVEILGFDKRFQKKDLNDMMHLIDELVETD